MIYVHFQSAADASGLLTYIFDVVQHFHFFACCFPIVRRWCGKNVLFSFSILWKIFLKTPSSGFVEIWKFCVCCERNKRSQWSWKITSNRSILLLSPRNLCNTCRRFPCEPFFLLSIWFADKSKHQTNLSTFSAHARSRRSTLSRFRFQETINFHVWSIGRFYFHSF